MARPSSRSRVNEAFTMVKLIFGERLIVPGCGRGTPATARVSPPPQRPNHRRCNGRGQTSTLPLRTPSSTIGRWLLANKEAGVGISQIIGSAIVRRTLYTRFNANKKRHKDISLRRLRFDGFGGAKYPKSLVLTVTPPGMTPDTLRKLLSFFPAYVSPGFVPFRQLRAVLGLSVQR